MVGYMPSEVYKRHAMNAGAMSRIYLVAFKLKLPLLLNTEELRYIVA